ncbi:MAG: cobalt ABC transporter [Chlorobium sp.]|nr:MAG: cobalt ABC transporter [Chlorobium sp.]
MNNQFSSSESAQTSTPFFLGSDRSALLVTTLFVLCVISIPKFNLSELFVFAAFPIFVMSAARLPSKIIVNRLLLISPFVLFMASGNILLDRTPLWTLYGVTFSKGMVSGMVIVAKTMITIAGLQSVTLCIPFYRICRALTSLHIPDVLVTQLMLLNRYSSVLNEEAASMQKARDMRSFGKKGKELLRTASLIGSLLLRTTARAERIYRAMSARGFNSQKLIQDNSVIAAGEWLTTGVWALFFLSLRLIF